MKYLDKVSAERKEQPGKDEELLKYDKLTIKHCKEEVPAECKLQPREDERGGKGAAASWKG